MTNYFERKEVANEALEFIAPDIVAAAPENEQEKAITAGLRLSQSALSAFHPDRQPTGGVVDQAQAQLAQLNQLIGEIASTPDAPQMIQQDAESKVGNRINILAANQQYGTVIQGVEKQIEAANISSVEVSTDDSVNQYLPVVAGEEVHAPVELLSMILGRGVIATLANGSGEQLQAGLHQVRKRLLKSADRSDFLFHSLSDWNHLFDQLASTKNPIENHQLLRSTMDTNRLATRSIEQNDHRTQSLLHKLSPDSTIQFPEQLLRSYSGMIIAPYGEWPGYTQAVKNQTSPDIGPVAVLQTKGGVIETAVTVDPDRRVATTLLDKLEQPVRDELLQLIHKTADELGYNQGEFIKPAKGESGEMISGEPMDFLFLVDDSGQAQVMYTRPIIGEGVSLPRVDIGSSLQPGYYMIKAGRDTKTKQYQSRNTPLALVELEPELQDRTLAASVGTAVIASYDYSHGGFDEMKLFDFDDMSVDLTKGPIFSAGSNEFKKVRGGAKTSQVKVIKAIHDQTDGLRSRFHMNEKTHNSGHNSLFLLGSKQELWLLNASSSHKIMFIDQNN